MDEDEELDLALYNEALEQEQRELEVSTMRRHRLKTLEAYFNLSRQGVKPYEVRENDRLYQRGDIVELYNIKKNFSGIPEIRTIAGAWAPWPLDSFTKQPLSLDMFETDFLHSLECITCRISFVLPGNEKIGLFDDYVILSLEVDNYRGSDWPSGRAPDLFTTAPGYNADFANNPANQIKPDIAIPSGIVWNTDEHGFYNINGSPMPKGFLATWLSRKDEFPQTSNAVDPKPEDTPVEDVRCIPSDIFWDENNDKFCYPSGKFLGENFQKDWHSRHAEFPTYVAPKYTRDGKLKA